MSNVTLEEIRGLPLEIRSSQDTNLIAQFLPARVSIISKPIGPGTILAKMAPYGGTFLNSLKALAATDANVEWSLEMIKQGTFDIGDPVARVQLLQFSLDHPEVTQAISTLMAVAEVATPVDEFEVRKLCWSDNGEWQA